jgi:hypothetical protein
MLIPKDKVDNSGDVGCYHVATYQAWFIGYALKWV